jgi:hypothetical protein
MPARLQAPLAQQLLRQLVQIGQHRLQPPLHVDPVIAVPDRLIERRQFLRMRNDALGRSFDEATSESCSSLM